VAFDKPVLLIHGDGATPSFALQQRLVPRWKYW
jgi:hypothetical protein